MLEAASTNAGPSFEWSHSWSSQTEEKKSSFPRDWQPHLQVGVCEGEIKDDWADDLVQPECLREVRYGGNGS